MSFIRYLKQRGRAFLEDRGYEIYRRPWLPRGFDPFATLHATWPGWQPKVVFDVGANTGQTVARVRAAYPAATIHAFEPVATTYSLLQAAVAPFARVHAHCLALAERAGELWIAPQSDSTLNSLHCPASDSRQGDVRVELQTAAAFCAARDITHIDLLKIDVEGAELSVLRGAAPLFVAGEIDFVLVEAGLMPGEARFTPLADLIGFLRPHGFWLVGIYDQHGWHRFHAAEFCNALFAHERYLAPDSPAFHRA